uniref:Uncharacterized protein n=1 Tax=Sphaerodactylus townsendi TaxID=933632 RepID=A0ACB8FLC9_9SAUR
MVWLPIAVLFFSLPRSPAVDMYGSSLPFAQKISFVGGSPGWALSSSLSLRAGAQPPCPRKSTDGLLNSCQLYRLPGSSLVDTFNSAAVSFMPDHRCPSV